MDQATIAKRVLVVDDNVDAGLLIAELLRMRGHHVDVAIGGPEGYAAAVATLPEVVVLDIGMPVMDGYQVAIALRGEALTQSVRLIALTAWGDSASKACAFQSGFDGHLVKPANFEALFQAVEYETS